jgi:hypothetical protein
MTIWEGRAPADELARWQEKVQGRDEESPGHDDDTESNDPYHPWRGGS